MDFPIYVYEEGMELPEKGIYYVIASNGSFVHKDTTLVKGLVKIEGDIPDLCEVQPHGEVKFPPVPASIVYKAKKFFQKVWDVHKSESAVLLHYSYTEGYYVDCPQQTVTGGSVNYERNDRFQGSDKQRYICVGTIHSHCNFSAFHSGTDEHDESDFDGVHLTFGHVDREDFSVAASIVVSNNRFKVDPITVAEGLVAKESAVKGDAFFTLADSGELDVEAIQKSIDEEWLPKVSKGVTHIWHGTSKSKYHGWGGWGNKHEGNAWWDDDTNVSGKGSDDDYSFQSYSYNRSSQDCKEVWTLYDENGTEIEALPGKNEDWDELEIGDSVKGLRVWKHTDNGEKVFAYSSTQVCVDVGSPRRTGEITS